MVGLAKKISNKLNLYDYPDGKRKLQVDPVPKVGGIAVAVVFTFIVLTYASFNFAVGSMSLYLAVLIPSLLAAVLGLVDDYRDLNPFLRLFSQFLIGSLAWFMGTKISLFQFDLLNFILFNFIFMLILNGINLIDNSDGLAASSVLVIASSATVIALLSKQELIPLLTISIAGVALGFLFHNWQPARVYLGDSGAYFLGALLAISLFRLNPPNVSPIENLMVVALLAILPIADTFFVVIRRIYNGIHPFTAGRDHLAHQLQGRGIRTSRSVLYLQVVPVTFFAGTLIYLF